MLFDHFAFGTENVKGGAMAMGWGQHIAELVNGVSQAKSFVQIVGAKLIYLIFKCFL